MITRKTILRRINKGVELLNKIRPNWLKKIKLATLDMEMPDDCIIGQVYGNYYKGVEKLDPKIKNEWGYRNMAFDFGSKYGFAFSTKDVQKYFKNNITLFPGQTEFEALKLLTEIWREKITELRKVA